MKWVMKPIQDSAKSCLMLMMDQTNLSHGSMWRQNLIEALYLFQHFVVQINAYILFIVISLWLYYMNSVMAYIMGGSSARGNGGGDDDQWRATKKEAS